MHPHAEGFPENICVYGYYPLCFNSSLDSITCCPSSKPSLSSILFFANFPWNPNRSVNFTLAQVITHTIPNITQAATSMPTMKPARCAAPLLGSRKLYGYQPAVACVIYAKARYRAKTMIRKTTCKGGGGLVLGRINSKRAKSEFRAC